MPIIEKSGLMRCKDDTGNMHLLYPITTAENVDGLDELIDEAKILGTAVSATSTDGIAYSATVPGITELTAGISFVMVPNKLSTSRNTTLNVNNLGAKNLRVRLSGYTATTVSPGTTNWLSSNKPVRVTYDGMWWVAEIIIPSANQLYGDVPAEDVSYSNANSGLTATQVQAAIDELASGKLKTQVLTTQEYNAIESKDENVLYMLSDDTTDSDIQAHMANSDIHVTAEEKEAWNNSGGSLPVDVEILETICENIELTKANNTYTLPTSISISWTDLFCINYRYYNGDTLENEGSGCWFSKPKFEANDQPFVYWFTMNSGNRVYLTNDRIVDTWVGDSPYKAIVSIYKVNVLVNDHLKWQALLSEGFGNAASGYNSHAEGESSQAYGWASHTEGYNTDAYGDCSHAEGCQSIASGHFSHTEGQNTLAIADSSHAEGYHSRTNGKYSHAEGYNTNAYGAATHVQGRWNVIQDADSPEDYGQYCHIVGNGASNSSRSNAHTLDWSGNAWFAGDVYTGGTDMATGAKKLATGAEVGSYTGTSGSKTLTFSFEPAAIIIIDYIHNILIAINGMSAMSIISSTSTYKPSITWNEKSVTINGANEKQCKYYYVAFPKA